MQLSAEQRRAVETGLAVRVADAETHEEYVVISTRVFERLRDVLQLDEADPSFFECDEVDSPTML